MDPGPSKDENSFVDPMDARHLVAARKTPSNTVDEKQLDLPLEEKPQPRYIRGVRVHPNYTGQDSGPMHEI